VRAQLREHDLVARLGGDEFAVLLTPLQARRCRAHRREDHRQHAAADPAGGWHPHHQLAQCRYRLYPDDGHDPASLLNAADAAMYQAKRKRRGHGKWRRRNAAPRM
jgi:diguanylate cyclase (GGDEF)-like protein